MATTTPCPPAEAASKTLYSVAWACCVLFYFLQYALRSAPGVMVPELSAAFGILALGISALIGLYYHTYSAFAIVSGACVDRYGARYVIRRTVSRPVAPLTF